MKTLKNLREGTEYDLDPITHFKGRAVGMISASRGNLSPESNAARNHELRGSLLKLGYNVFPAKGHYTEEGPPPRPVHEESHIVTRRNLGPDEGALHTTLMQMGKKYDQDTILYKPHDSDVASLHEPATGKSFEIGRAKKGIHGENFTTLPNGKSFTFA